MLRFVVLVLFVVMSASAAQAGPFRCLKRRLDPPPAVSKDDFSHFRSQPSSIKAEPAKPTKPAVPPQAPPKPTK